MDLTCQDEERWYAWRHAGALFDRFFDYRNVFATHPALKPAYESQVMISTEGFDGVADVRNFSDLFESIAFR